MFMEKRSPEEPLALGVFIRGGSLRPFRDLRNPHFSALLLRNLKYPYISMSIIFAVGLRSDYEICSHNVH